MKKTPSCPKEWPHEVKRLWRHVHDTYALDRHHETLLRECCHMFSRAAQCRKAISEQGILSVDRYGTVQPSKLLAEERACANSGRLLIRELALDAVDGNAPSSPDELSRLSRGANYK